MLQLVKLLNYNNTTIIRVKDTILIMLVVVFLSGDIEQIVMRPEKWVIRVGCKDVRSPSTAINNMID